MTPTPLARHSRGARRSRGAAVRWALIGAFVLLVFALGIALGEALHDNPKPGVTQTLERTISLPHVPPGSTITP